jgi:pimeloyl-ACP methyl ester carboxylesterase
MQLGSLAPWIKRETPLWEGEHFVVSASGAGRDVVFVHGLAASPECWDEATRLVSGVRAHTIHMRGFGGLAPSGFRSPMNFLKPMADALAGYIRTLRVGPVPVVGHSMGGLASLMLARDHADVVDRTMVVDVPAFFSVLITPFANATSMAPLAQHSRRTYAEKSRAQHQDDIRRASAKLVTGQDQLEAEVMVTDLRGDLRRIQSPVDVVYAWDKVSPASKMGLDQVYAAAYSGLAQGRLHRIDDARHYVMLDQPDAFYGAVNGWLAR